ncbi:flavin reductase family protein, partial [Escherichia coli]|uniref:flavin reductase family protein n=1 Tax=Escherichia coli TaxID=562 RepID=UPI0027385E22
DRSIKEIKAIDTNLEKALGRISSGLYIITAQKGDVNSAMLASWVMQASFEPLGLTIAVAKDRAIESLMQVGDRFVLNVLEEGNHLHL